MGEQCKTRWGMAMRRKVSKTLRKYALHQHPDDPGARKQLYKAYKKRWPKHSRETRAFLRVLMEQAVGEAQ
jgi:hypothetical protein